MSLFGDLEEEKVSMTKPLPTLEAMSSSASGLDSGGIGFESGGKSEGAGSAEHLLLLFSETGRIVPALNTVFERNWTKQYEKVLSKHVRSKEEEIRNLCNDHYTDFIEAIDQLIRVENKVLELRTDINQLNDGVQQKGKVLEDEMVQLINLRRTRQRMGSTMRHLKRILAAVELYKSVVDLVNAKRYVNALKQLNTLVNTHLVSMHEFSIVRDMLETIDGLKSRIRHSVDTHFFAWVNQMDRKSRELGSMAMAQQRSHLTSSGLFDGSVGMISGGIGTRQKLLETEMQQRIKLQFGGAAVQMDDASAVGSGTTPVSAVGTNPFALPDPSSAVPGPSTPMRGVSATVTEQPASLFEKIESENFLPVYECINVHQLLGILRKLSDKYLRRRRGDLERLCNVTTGFNALRKKSRASAAGASPGSSPVIPTGGSSSGSGGSAVPDLTRGSIAAAATVVTDKSTDVSTYLSNICGFFIFEHAICTRYSQLIDNEELSKLWMDVAIPEIRKVLKNDVIKFGSLTSPITLLFVVKNELIILIRVLENYDFKVSLVYAFLEQLRIEFERRLLLDLSTKVRNTITEDIKQGLPRLDIANREDYNNCLQMFGVKTDDSGLGAGSLDEEKKSSSSSTGMKRSRSSGTRLSGLDERSVLPAADLGAAKDEYERHRQIAQKEAAKDNVLLLGSDFDPTRAAIDFPISVPFSMMVSKICMDLLDFIESYQTFAKNGHDMNARIRTAFETGIVDGVCRQLNGIVVRGELSLSILAQIAVNCRYLQMSLAFFENELAMDESTQQFLGESLRIPKLHKAREAFEGVHSQTIDTLIGLFTEDLKTLLIASFPGSSYFTTDRIESGPRDWIVKLIRYLKQILQKDMKYLNFEYRESGYYIAFATIKMFLKSVLFGMEMDLGGGADSPLMDASASSLGVSSSATASHGSMGHSGTDVSMKKWNVIGMYNMNLDVTALEEFAAESGVSALSQQLAEIRVLLDLLLSGAGILDYLDEDMRDSKYAYIQPHDLISVMEKWKPLGLMTRLPKGSKIPKISKDVVKKVLKSLRE